MFLSKDEKLAICLHVIIVYFNRTASATRIDQPFCNKNESDQMKFDYNRPVVEVSVKFV